MAKEKDVKAGMPPPVRLVKMVTVPQGSAKKPIPREKGKTVSHDRGKRKQ